MSFKSKKIQIIRCVVSILFFFVFFSCNYAQQDIKKPRVIVSSDIGGTDPDDFQSMIHLCMYSDLFTIEGLISSPFGDGRKEHILDIIDIYEDDYKQLSNYSKELYEPDCLRNICKQGSIPGAPFKGYSEPTEGSEWIIQCAKKESDQPLWVLVWGGIEDLAQALHDAPEIKNNIRVYWIGGPNKKWSINAYAYIAENHPDLWFIESNATYRGWFMDDDSPEDIKGDTYYDNFIKGRGALGKDFKNYYKGRIKMGDTPSLAYLMNGNADEPTGESWGGSYEPITRSSRVVFNRNTTTADTVATYGTIEWLFNGPYLDIPEDSACFTLDVNKQLWPGYYLGEGKYGVRYSSKHPETTSYNTSSNIAELDGHKGHFVSVNPWPGEISPYDYPVGPNWYSDRTDTELFIGKQQGAKTISKFRKEFLSDWAERWGWLE